MFNDEGFDGQRQSTTNCAPNDGKAYRLDDEVSRSASRVVLGVDGERDLPQILCLITTGTRAVEVVEQDVAETSYSVNQACNETLRSMSVNVFGGRKYRHSPGP